MKRDVQFDSVDGYFEAGFDGSVLVNGKSAYEIAVDNGFVGTEEEWLDSLKGYTPIKGIDYWTAADKAEMANDVIVGEGNSGDVIAIANMTTRTENLDISKFEMGSLNGAANSTYHNYNRARTPEIQVADFDTTIVAINGVACIVIVLFDNDDNFVSSSSWGVQHTIPAGTHYKLLITPDPYSITATPLNEIIANFYTIKEYEIVKRIEELENREIGGTGGESIPSYVQTEALMVLDEVIAAQTERTINIGAMGDWHVYTNGTGSNVAKNNWAAAKHAIQAMALISKRIKLDVVACTGDYIVGDSYYSADGWLDVVGTFNEYMDEISTDTLVKTYGNHDVGYGGSVFIPPAKSRPFIAAYNDHMNLGSLTRGYGYKDLPNHKVRLIVVNTCEFNNAADYSKSFLVSNAQYKWFANALDVSSKEDAAQWQTIIISHHPMDWSGSKFPSILSAYESGVSVTLSGTTYNYDGINSARVIGNIHGHLHNALKGTISGTTIKRWCVPNICYDYSNTYEGWKESKTYEKTINTADDTVFYVFSINLDTGMVKRTHYGAGYSDSTNYMNGSGGTGGGDTGGDSGDSGDSGDTNATNWYWLGQDESGNIINGQGWLNNYRLSSSTGEAKAEVGYVATGYIPFKHYDTISVYSNTTFFDAADTNCVMNFYDANHSPVFKCAATSLYQSLGITVVDGCFTWTLYSNDRFNVNDVAYVRLSAYKNGGDGTDFVVNIS